MGKKRRKKYKRSWLARLRKRGLPVADYLLAFIVVGLTLFGILMVYDTSLIVAFEQWGDRLWFFKRQTFWAIIGVAGGLFVSLIDYKFWRKVAPALFLASLILLVLVLIPGFSSEVYGARTRLALPDSIPILSEISVQPSELMKLSLVMYLAHLFTAYQAKKQQKFPHKQFLIIIGITSVLIAVEPDLGNALLVAATAFVMYFVAGANIMSVLGIFLLGAAVALGYAFSSEYRRDRLFTFLNPLNDPQGSSYQITQILIALGSGGLFGLGIGNSRQKYQYIPEVMTDSIFAVIGEELGFIGALIVLAALFFVIWRGFAIALACEEKFGRLLGLGIVTNIGVQAIVNLGGMLGLMPLTGVPLPFISYGGSSLTLLLISVGILLNISRTSKVS